MCTSIVQTDIEMDWKFSNYRQLQEIVLPFKTVPESSNNIPFKNSRIVSNLDVTKKTVLFSDN